MKPWEAKDEHNLFELLAGDWYGENPEQRLEVLRADKEERAKYFFNQLGLNAESIVLEIGSGGGFTTKHVAKGIKQLHCCDISGSFLEYAKRECDGINNIFFYKIVDPPRLPIQNLLFDAVFADAVFIHLNLYDIYWYFSEFDKVVKPGGVVWINIMDDSAIDRIKLEEMAEYYNRDKNSLQMLLCWNSVRAVVEVARYFGFSLISKHSEVGVELKFRKNRS